MNNHASILAEIRTFVESPRVYVPAPLPQKISLKLVLALGLLIGFFAGAGAVLLLR